MKNKITDLQKQFASDLNNSNSRSELTELHNKYLSKKSGITNNLLKELPKLDDKAKKEFGPLLNKIKISQKKQIEEKEKEYEKNLISNSSIDLTTKIPPRNIGHLHPTTEVIRQLNNFFHYYGYSVLEGPEIETAEYNFRKLNLPEDHPATDLQDTLFISEPDILLRTHTSSVESRVLTDYEPPIRVVVPGKVYRNETSNKTNSSFFHQYQGFVVDKGITIQHLKHTLELAHKFLFGDGVVLRFRYKYYPEVSPGMGVDMRCQFCDGVGCDVCKHRGYIEMLGSGMIHYNTLKACGIDPEVYTGFAFGMGLDRFVMSKYGVGDIRKLYGEELTYKS